MPKLYLVGTGPGSHDLITPEAIKALENSDIIMGYEKYIELIRPAIRNKSLESGPVGLYMKEFNIYAPWGPVIIKVVSRWPL